MNVWAVLGDLAAGATGAEVMAQHGISRATLYRYVKDFRGMGAELERQRGKDSWRVTNWAAIKSRVAVLRDAEERQSLLRG